MAIRKRGWTQDRIVLGNGDCMKQYENISDEDLIVRLRGGESGISDYLMEKYKGLVKQRAGIISRKKRLLFKPLQESVLTARFTMRSKAPTGRSISR